ncbi:MAG: hypothetical protein QOD70_1426 [Frankiales bacterium]|jgi:hypothetical protein|nr:hypothetical protein [Frankiales bacterium]
MFTRTATLVLSTAALLAATASTPASASDNGAAVIRPDAGQCLATASTGASWLFSCQIQIVFGPSGTITQHIAGSVIDGQSSPLPSRAVTDVTGGPCLVLGGQVLTTVVAGTVTPSGQVQLTCMG